MKCKPFFHSELLLIYIGRRLFSACFSDDSYKLYYQRRYKAYCKRDTEISDIHKLCREQAAYTGNEYR